MDSVTAPLGAFVFSPKVITEWVPDSEIVVN